MHCLATYITESGKQDACQCTAHAKTCLQGKHDARETESRGATAAHILHVISHITNHRPQQGNSGCIGKTFEHTQHVETCNVGGLKQVEHACENGGEGETYHVDALLAVAAGEPACQEYHAEELHHGSHHIENGEAHTVCLGGIAGQSKTMKPLIECLLVDVSLKIEAHGTAPHGKCGKDEQRYGKHAAPRDIGKREAHVLPHVGMLRGGRGDALAGGEEGGEQAYKAHAGIETYGKQPAACIIAAAQLSHQRKRETLHNKLGDGARHKANAVDARALVDVAAHHTAQR